MRKNNKRALYESIMRNVAKLVKKTLTEQAASTIMYSDLFIDTMSDVLNTQFAQGNKLSIALNDNILNINEKLLVDLAGYLIEGVVYYAIKDLSEENSGKLIFPANVIDKGGLGKQYYDANPTTHRTLVDDEGEEYEQYDKLPDSIAASVTGKISNLYRRGEKCGYDFDFTLNNGIKYKVEIKSHYKNTATKFTANEQSIKDELLIIDVLYDIDGNSIIVKKIQIGFGNDIALAGGKDNQPYYIQRKNSKFRANNKY